MREMFSHSLNLTYLDLSSFETKNVTDMNGMFRSCGNLKNIDLSSFNTQKVINYYFIFENCNKLERVILNLRESKIKKLIDSYKIIYC